MEEAEAQARVGTLLCGKWTLDRLLGVGGMAAVYASTHKIGRRDAIKILHPEVARVKEMRARFELEAHVANRFKHPGAVEIRDVDKTEDGCPFFVMELLDGESLTEVARRGPVDVGALLGWVDALLDVLSAAHAEGIIHRDVKLDNLFLTKDGRLKVLDFGIARVRDAQAQGFQKTAIGVRLGTATYMPPEQVQGRDIDGRADLFAVGATMFRLVARRRIHEAPTEAEMLVKMSSQPAPPLASVADAPPNVCLVVDRALRFQREDRYPDAATMRADVGAVRAGSPPPHALQRAGADASMKSTMAVRSVRSSELTTAREPAAAGPRDATRAELDPRPSPKVALGQTAPAISVREVPASVAYAVEAEAGPASFASTVAGPSSRAPTPRAPHQASVAAAAVTSVLSIPSAPSSRAPTPLVGTLKSAGVVPLPDQPPPSAPLVAIASAPQLAPKKSNLRLVLFGAAFLVLGVVVTVIAAWPSAPAGHEGVDMRKPPSHKKH